MSFSTNWAGLKADMMQDSDDFSSDYMANADTIIAEAETMLLRDLDLEIFQDEGTAGALTAGNRLWTFPTNLVKINGLWLVISGSRRFIERRAKGYCEMYGEDASVQERPSYYGFQNETQLYFVNTPDQAYPVVTYGITRPLGLSDDNPTTWLSQNAGDLLLMLCKIKGEQYLSNPDKATMWRGEYNNTLLPKAKIELRGASRASYEAARMASQATQVL